MKCLLRLVAASALVVGGAAEARAAILYGVDIDSDRLLTINTSTGVATAVGAVGALGFDFVGGLTFDPNKNILYGVDEKTDQLLTINTSTGVATAIGPLGFDVVIGLAFDSDNEVIPEPTTLAIWSVLGGIGLVASRRRRKRKAA